MKRNSIIFLFLSSAIPIGADGVEQSFGIDMEALHDFTQKDSERSRQETERREGVDKPWLLLRLRDLHEGKQPSDEELQRVWEIYRAERNHKPEDKLVAFRLIAEVEDVSKWQRGFDALAYSENPQFVKTAIQTLFWKLASGSEREKIVLSNKTAVMQHLVEFAEENKADTTIDRDAVKILELTKPYVGKTPPAEARRPGKRSLGSPTGDAREAGRKISDSSSAGTLVQRVGKGGIFTIGGIVIAGILIWWRKFQAARR